MARKKKTKPAEEFTPHDLNSLEAQTRRIVGRTYAVEEAEERTRSSKLIRKILITILTILLILLILWLVSIFITLYGDLVISTDRSLRENGIQLCAEESFKDPAIQLSAPKVQDATNITYDWLPKNLDKKDGAHNGENYLAYTFYLRNGGKNTLLTLGKIQVYYRRVRSCLLTFRKFCTRKEKHTKGLNVIFVYITINCKYHLPALTFFLKLRCP